VYKSSVILAVNPFSSNHKSLQSVFTKSITFFNKLQSTKMRFFAAVAASFAVLAAAAPTPQYGYGYGGGLGGLVGETVGSVAALPGNLVGGLVGGVGSAVTGVASGIVSPFLPWNWRAEQEAAAARQQ
jgi:hypothetical protein